MKKLAMKVLLGLVVSSPIICVGSVAHATDLQCTQQCTAEWKSCLKSGEDYGTCVQDFHDCVANCNSGGGGGGGGECFPVACRD